jgi:hypothetical protein
MHCDYLPEAGRLLKLERIAVWNKDKIVLAISTSICVADIVLLIRGECSLQIMGECFVNEAI